MEEGYASDDIHGSISLICDKCASSLQMESFQVENVDQFLGMQSVQDNGPLKLAVDTIKLLHIQRPTISLSIMKDSAIINTIKIMGSNSESFVTPGLLIALSSTNNTKSFGSGCYELTGVIVEGNIRNDGILEICNQHSIGVIFCSGNIDENISYQLTNMRVMFISNISQKDTLRLCDTFCTTSIPSLFLEELISQESLSRVRISSFDGFLSEQSVHSDTTDYILVDSLSCENNRVTCVICHSTSCGVDTIEEKYFECMIFLINSINSGYVKSKLGTYLKCLEKIADTDPQPLQELVTSLKDMVWLGISTSGFNKNTCHAITNLDVCDSENFSFLNNQTDTYSLIAMFHITKDIFYTFLNSDVVLR